MKSNFTAILTLCVLIIIGAVVIPLLDVANEPRPEQGKTLFISFNWSDANAKVVEQNVTSVIEGLVSAVNGVEETSSESYFGGGNISIVLKKEADVSAVKFEISSLLKSVYNKLPKNVSYPSLSGGEVTNRNTIANEEKEILRYEIFAKGTDEQIIEYLNKKVIKVLKKVEGVSDVVTSGGKSMHLEIDFDPIKVISSGITPSDIQNAISNFMGKDSYIGEIVSTDEVGDKVRMSLYLTMAKYKDQLEHMPIKTINGSIIYLNDLATFEYKLTPPEYYFRVNGLSTIYMTVFCEPDASRISVSQKVKEIVEEYNAKTKNGIYLKLNWDNVKDQLRELQELITQSLLSLAILLVFVWLSRRQWKYMLIISVTLVANIMMAVIAYWFFDIRLHPFSLAGITVSLGLIIDASIVMTDHYSYYRDRKSWLAIMAALLTTIGSLVVVFFMPEETRHTLKDFSWVLIINLSVALVVAALFVPALVDSLHYYSRKKGRIDRQWLTLHWKKAYTKYIAFTQHRKWIYYTILILAFGIPFYALPEKVGPDANGYVSVDEERREPTWYEDFYNEVFGSKFFLLDVKPILTNVFGGSMRLFAEGPKHSNHNDEEKPYDLYIYGRMPIGGTAAELNDKVRMIEQFLSQFKELEYFYSQVSGGSGYIKAVTKEEYKKKGFPFILERKVIGKLISIGGADWQTYGVSDRGFSNSLNLQYRSQRIQVSGYDYAKLYRFAELLSDSLKKNPRITDLVVQTLGRGNQEDEFYMRYNREKITAYNDNVGQFVGRVHSSLSSLLSENEIGKYDDGKLVANVVLKSTMRDKFDVWQLFNSYIKVDTTDVKLSEFMEIAQREAKNVIPKKNQEYSLEVAFNTIGNTEYTGKYIKRVIDNVNSKLPVGFRCHQGSWGRMWTQESTQYWLIVLVVVIIFFICSILFESLRLPFVIISTIPVSLIGTFLTFHYTGVEFGDGGLASLVLLCGLVVNSGIYIVNEYRNMERDAEEKGLPVDSLRMYVKAYNHKIVPVFLTTLSTVMGLLPFLLYSETQKFWFSFAVGSLGGLAFSIIALIFVMPIFMNLKSNSGETLPTKPKRVYEGRFGHTRYICKKIKEIRLKDVKIYFSLMFMKIKRICFIFKRKKHN